MRTRPGWRPGCRHEPRQFSFLPFCLANVAFSPPLPRFLYPSLTRTKPICSETRVTGGVDKPCSCTLPRDAPPAPPFFSLLPQYFVFFDSIAAAVLGRRCRSAGSAEPHSCHTPAPLQCISSSRGHGSVSAVITTGILIIISNGRNVFFMQIMKGKKPQSENNEGPNLEERKRIPVWLTEHLLSRRNGGGGGVGGAGGVIL